MENNNSVSGALPDLGGKINLTESEIQLAIIHEAQKRGYIVIRMNSGRARHNIRLAPSGTPDLFLVGHHENLWVEVKDYKGKLRPEQENMIANLRDRFEFVIVARCVEDVFWDIKPSRES